MQTETDKAAPEQEGRFHRYVGSTIPWYVHVIWVLFWCFAVYYVVQYLLPMLQSEIASPPP